MGIDDAVKAVEFLQPKRVVPFHYKTWDIIDSKPEEFKKKVKGSEVVILKPGDSLDI
jgi:L-ascorbate metabolism protein UlaG (beta-lactamase superfamily)